MSRAGLLVVLAIAAVVGLVFGIWPEFDLALAAPFYDPARGGFWRAFDPFHQYLRDAATWVIAAIAASAGAALVWSLAWPHRTPTIPGRAAVLMLVTLALGPGVLTNLVLKEYWHRPRPIDVTEFRGDEHFRPWWDPRGDCPKNCSFVSGDVSAAFWTLAPALLAPVPWRLLATGAALAFGTAVGFLRMAAGAHFFSDVAFAGILTFVVIWLTHGFIYRWRRTRVEEDAVERMLARLRQASLRVVGRGDT